jgi:hypothetical protein
MGYIHTTYGISRSRSLFNLNALRLFPRIKHDIWQADTAGMYSNVERSVSKADKRRVLV